MDAKDKRDLIEIYQRYGFEKSDRGEVLVFTLKTGYFDNADIVPLSPGANTGPAFDEFTKTGFACTVRRLLSPGQAEKQLFKGFFSVDSILARLQSDYERFTSSIVSAFSGDAQYSYINAPYLINGQEGNSSPAEEVASRLENTKPTLFLIEAAAGFGKTCTAFELVSKLVKVGDYLPLFSELARNRQAVIFRHILLDEIDRTFPVLSSRLVQTEMKNGRVITILDGFDELLRKTEDGQDFENSEPMLETIGEFLTGNAKIVLTTRRTVLFEGDAFHSWVEKHEGAFELVRMKISEPRVEDWLSAKRHEALSRAGIEVENIANPVLLSYLRCISDTDFSRVALETHKLVEKYFEFMLEREQGRQDLRMDAVKQQSVLCSIAEDMIQYGYTSEQREYIVDHLLNTNSKLLDDVLLLYPPSQRPTKENLANKLASHALLDRSSREPNKIGFVNEFVFGHFIGMTILKAKEWLNDDLRFIEPAVISYQPRSVPTKNELWQKIKNSADFLPISNRIEIAVRLKNEIPFDLIDDEASGLKFSGVRIGLNSVTNFQFNDCTFHACVFDISHFQNVTFLNCRYFGCSIEGGQPNGQIYVFDCSGEQQFIEHLTASNREEMGDQGPDRAALIDQFILEKFWPRGRETILHKHRPISGVATNKEFKRHEIYDRISLLKKRGILRDGNFGAFLEIDVANIQEIRQILGRVVHD
jgi:hypothetical protein